jgi:hypothetical protein
MIQERSIACLVSTLAALAQQVTIVLAFLAFLVIRSSVVIAT